MGLALPCTEPEACFDPRCDLLLSQPAERGVHAGLFRAWRDAPGRLPSGTTHTVAAMALLSHMMRTAAVTGRTDTIGAWVVGRQGGRWAEQTVRAAIPTAGHPAQGTPAARRDPAPADPAGTLRELTELHARGVVTDAEFESLRADLRT